MATAITTLDDVLLSELECPMCLEYMFPPITLCENGHNICSVCRPQLDNCHSCRGMLTNTRCLTLEKILENFQYPCRYRKVGCDQTFPACLIGDHHAVCQFSPYKCPMDGCEWKGSSFALCTHVEEVHMEQIQIFSTDNLMVITDYDIDREYTRVIRSGNQVFVASISVRNNVWHFVLQCVSSEETASAYQYTVTLSGTERGCIKVTHLTKGIKEKLEDIYKSSKCVKVPVEVIEQFIIENDLFFYLEVKEL